MIRVVFDSNVIVSALVFGGVPRRIFELAEDGLCELFYSAPIQAEVLGVLAEKFHWHEAMLKEVLPVVWDTGTLVVPQVTIHAIAGDPDDNRILECAWESKADLVVSGDHHLLDLGRYRSIQIITPREFLTLYSVR